MKRKRKEEREGMGGGKERRRCSFSCHRSQTCLGQDFLSKPQHSSLQESLLSSTWATSAGSTFSHNEILVGTESVSERDAMTKAFIFLTRKKRTVSKLYFIFYSIPVEMIDTVLHKSLSHFTPVFYVKTTCICLYGHAYGRVQRSKYT